MASSLGYRLKSTALKYVPTLVLDEPKGAHTGLLAKFPDVVAGQEDGLAIQAATGTVQSDVALALGDYGVSTFNPTAATDMALKSLTIINAGDAAVYVEGGASSAGMKVVGGTEGIEIGSVGTALLISGGTKDICLEGPGTIVNATGNVIQIGADLALAAYETDGVAKEATLTAMKGATFDTDTDSLEEIRDNLGSGGGTGTGARTVTITVTDGTSNLEGATVRTTNGADSYVRATNASGVIVFALDDKTWSVAITKSGYTFTPTTLVVAANVTQTYTMTAINVPASNPGFVTGYIYCYDQDGVVEEGVYVQMKFSDIAGTGHSYDRAIRTVISDVDGLVSFSNLIPGASYLARRGTESGWVEIEIDIAAANPVALTNFFGEDD